MKMENKKKYSGQDRSLDSNEQIKFEEKNHFKS
jgi:hypothetical protein